MLSISGAQLPSELTELCDAVLLPMSFCLPDVPGVPLVYANQPFEYMTGAKIHEILGRNYSFLNGRLTDSSLSEELELALTQHKREAGCVISYRTDGTAFYHLLAFQPFKLSSTQLVVIACHAAFTPFTNEGSMQRTAEAIDRAWRGTRQHNRLAVNSVAEHDSLRLDAISMRFEAVFTRAQNTLIRRMSASISNPVYYHSAKGCHSSPERLNNISSLDVEALNRAFDLGPLSKPAWTRIGGIHGW